MKGDVINKERPVSRYANLSFPLAVVNYGGGPAFHDPTYLRPRHPRVHRQQDTLDKQSENLAALRSDEERWRSQVRHFCRGAPVVVVVVVVVDVAVSSWCGCPYLSWLLYLLWLLARPLCVVYCCCPCLAVALLFRLLRPGLLVWLCFRRHLVAVLMSLPIFVFAVGRFDGSPAGLLRVATYVPPRSRKRRIG